MEKASNVFEFVGYLEFGKDNVKSLSSDKSDWKKKTLNMAVTDKNGNRPYVNVVGSFNKSLKIFGVKNDKGESVTLDIPYSEVNNKDVMDKIPDFKKFKVDVDDIKLTTISDWDFEAFVEANQANLKGKLAKVTGIIETSEWNGKIYTNYTVQRIVGVTDEAVKSEGTIGVYFTEDSLIKDNLKTTGIVEVNGYVDSYNKLAKDKTVFLPISLKFDFSKELEALKAETTTKEDKDRIAKRMDYLVKSFETYNEDGEKARITNGKVYYQDWKVRIISGTEEKEITMEDLTSDQRMVIELGISTFDEIKAQMRGRIQGEKKRDTLLIVPNMKNKSGAEDTKMTIDDLSNRISESTTPDIASKPEQQTKKVEVKVDSTDIDDMLAGI